MWNLKLWILNWSYNLTKLTIITILIIINLIILAIIYSDKLIIIGARLIIRASIITLFVTLLTNSWYAFILFLIYVTGLLVLFGYFLAIRPNIYQIQKHYFKYFLIICIRTVIIPQKITGTPQFIIKFEPDVIRIIRQINLPIYWFITIILLLTLLIVVSITYKSPSPLRKFL